MPNTGKMHRMETNLQRLKKVKYLRNSVVDEKVTSANYLWRNIWAAAVENVTLSLPNTGKKQRLSPFRWCLDGDERIFQQSLNIQIKNISLLHLVLVIRDTSIVQSLPMKIKAKI